MRPHSFDPSQLLRWYDRACRDLPWRRTRDPYAIWVSEIMLQQTQVRTAIPFYERWMRAFPTVESLARADEQEALALWQGLGYYRRCRYLLQGAAWIVEHGMPQTAEGWLRVPGVGAYTAAAVASIAFGEPAALVDGNVRRVFARLEACRETGGELERRAWDWARSAVHPHRPGDWNQALMELGATVCVPATPRCDECPLADGCLGHRYGIARELPTPTSKPVPVQMERLARIPYHEGRFGVEKIAPGEWWEGMWSFPISQRGEDVGAWGEDLGTVRHTVTHHKIAMRCTLVRCDTADEALRWLSIEELAAVPMPSPQRKALRLALRHLGLD